MTKTTIILAGGMSKRFGRSKPFLPLLGKPLLLHTMTQALMFSDEIVLTIGNTDSIQRYKRFLSRDVSITRDDSPQQSPLVGILAGLRSVKSSHAIVLACDLPFVNERVASLLLEEVSEHDATVPRWPNGNIEPLHSAYNVTETRSAARTALLMGQLKVSNMIDRLHDVKYIRVEELRRFDRDLLTFFNINTLRDLEKAERILKLQSK
jgi:molybdopterin-guanine dinucleotide biosynthesis protein A